MPESGGHGLQWVNPKWISTQCEKLIPKTTQHAVPLTEKYKSWRSIEKVYELLPRAERIRENWHGPSSVDMKTPLTWAAANSLPIL